MTHFFLKLVIIFRLKSVCGGGGGGRVICPLCPPPQMSGFHLGGVGGALAPP